MRCPICGKHLLVKKDGKVIARTCEHYPYLGRLLIDVADETEGEEIIKAILNKDILVTGDPMCPVTWFKKGIDLENTEGMWWWISFVESTDSLEVEDSIFCGKVVHCQRCGYTIGEVAETIIMTVRSETIPEELFRCPDGVEHKWKLMDIPIPELVRPEQVFSFMVEEFEPKKCLR